MKDPIIIEREELETIVRSSIHETLTQLGIKARTVSPWISQQHAFRLAGRKRVEAAKEKGIVAFTKKDPAVKQSRVMISRKDIKKLIRQPFI